MTGHQYPLPEGLFDPGNLRQCRSRDYCPDGHCPNGHVILTEPGGAACADTANGYRNDPETVAPPIPLICVKPSQAEKQRHASLPCSMHNGETPWNRI